MAQLLSQTITLTRSIKTKTLTLTLAPFSLLRRGRNYSSDHKLEVIEIELSDSSSSASPDGGGGGSGDEEVEVLGMRRLEDAIHGVLVRRAAPDWLPFVPGSSYWVPPLRRPLGVAELVGRMAAAAAATPMTEEESLSFTTVRGWPSSAYFVEGKSPHPVKRKSKKDATQTDDEES